MKPKAKLYQKQRSKLETAKIDDDSSHIRFRISKVCVVRVACYYYFHISIDEITLFRQSIFLNEYLSNVSHEIFLDELKT